MFPAARRGAPILFSDPTASPHACPWDLCVAGNLGSIGVQCYGRTSSVRISAIAGRTASMCCLSCGREDYAGCKQDSGLSGLGLPRSLWI